MPLNNPQRYPDMSAEFSVSPTPYVTSSTTNGTFNYAFNDYTLTTTPPSASWVTKWIMVTNNATGSNDVKVAFTLRGFTTNNYLTLGAGQSFSADLRLKSIWVSGSGAPIEIVAGLTGILASSVPTISASNGNPGVG